jgi:hypothetical protein
VVPYNDARRNDQHEGRGLVYLNIAKAFAAKFRIGDAISIEEFDRWIVENKELFQWEGSGTNFQFAVPLDVVTRKWCGYRIDQGSRHKRMQLQGVRPFRLKIPDGRKRITLSDRIVVIDLSKSIDERNFHIQRFNHIWREYEEIVYDLYNMDPSDPERRECEEVVASFDRYIRDIEHSTRQQEIALQVIRSRRSVHHPMIENRS